MTGVSTAQRYRLLFAELDQVRAARTRGAGDTAGWEAAERDCWDHIADAATCHPPETQGSANR